MTQDRALLALLGAVTLLAVGCGTQPIPKVAVAGTTITLPVPHWFRVGFGLALNDQLAQDPSAKIEQGYPFPPYDPGSPREDPQRGELVFALYDDTQTTFVTYLPIRYITRVNLDAASPAANPPDPTIKNLSKGQILAFVDIPDDAGSPAGTSYRIVAERWRRSESNPNEFEFHQVLTEKPAGEQMDWNGWGSGSPDQGIEITVVSAVDIGGTEHFTPPYAYGELNGVYGSQGVAASGDLDDLRPQQQKAMLWVPTPGGAPPAAWEVQIRYPRQKAEIVGVDLRSNNRSGAIVTWTPDPDAPAGGCGLDEGTIRLSIVDPLQLTNAVDVLYRLRDFASCGRVAAGEFAAESGTFAAYDIDGNAFSGINEPWFNDDWSFE